nr:MAG TPA: hypothetical protein [Bacteriophage sp.]
MNTLDLIHSIVMVMFIIVFVVKLVLYLSLA